MSENSTYNHDRELFELANELQRPIIDTNNRAEQVASLGNAEFEAIATEALTEEQTAAWHDVRTLVPLEAYDTLARDYVETTERLETANEQLAEVKQSMTDEQRRYDELVEAVSRIAPLGLERATELAARKKEEIELQRADDVRSTIAAETERFGELDDLFELAGQAWAIPTLVLRGLENANEEICTIIDEIPIDPTLRASEHRKFAEISERHIDAPEASKYITLYLEQNSGKVVTVGDLADFLYGDKVADINPAHVRGRITTTLGPMSNGLRIQEMLLEEGCLLQYGWRRQVSRETGKLVGSRHRIYRALRLDEVDSAPNYIEHGDSNSSFDGASSQPEITKEVVPVVDEPEETPVEETPVAVPAPVPTPPPARKKAPSAAPVPTPPPSAPAPRATKRAAKKTPAAPAKAPEKRPARPEPKWKIDFGKSIGESISALEADGLMEEGEITVGIASQKSSSLKFGTSTAVDRLFDANLLGVRPSNRNQIPKLLLSTSDLVVMHLFNTWKDTLGKGQRQKQALAMVQASVDAYFENRNKS